jgi:hypothetical protein
MNIQRERWALGIAALLGLAAVGLIRHDFDADDPFFYLGLTLLGIAVIGAHAAMNAHHHYDLTDEFEAGYRVGYRAGRRASLGSVQTGAGLVIPMRKRENRWPDTGDSPRESGKRL